MTLVLVSAPAEEPVTTSEARAHLRLNDEVDGALLSVLIAAARTTLEVETRRAFVTQGWKLFLDAWPGRELTLPIAPVQSVSSVSVADAEGTMVALEAGTFREALAREPPALMPASRAVLPEPGVRLSGIEIGFSAGYGAASAVPKALCQAILMLVAHWYEQREPVSLEGRAWPVPDTVERLIGPYRRPRL